MALTSRDMAVSADEVIKGVYAKPFSGDGCMRPRDCHVKLIISQWPAIYWLLWNCLNVS